MFLRSVSALGLIVGFTGSAGADPICVVCAGPDATYQCSLADDKKLAGITVPPKAIEAVCIKVLAKTGKHQSCQAIAAAKDTACDGAVRELSAKDYLAALSESDGSSKVEGLLPGAARVTTEGLAKTGEVISGSAKSTWHCLASLFTDC